MRILVNTRFLLLGKLEGFGRYTYEVLSRIVQNHPEHEFYFAFDREYDSSFVFAENVYPLVLSPPARHPFLFWWWFEVAIPRAYRKYRCEVFFSPDGFTSRSQRIKHNVITIHDLAYLHYPRQIGRTMRWYYRTFMPKFVRSAHEIVTVSRSTQQDLIDNFRAARTKTSWVYNGVQSIYKPLSETAKSAVREQWSEGCMYFIAIGAIHPRKNIPNTVRAYELFRKQTTSKTKLLLVGRPAWQTKEVTNLLSSSDYRSDVISTGFVSDQDLAELLAAAHGLLYVSLLEGFGLPVAEAMQCGVPVITSNRSSMREIADDSALLVDPEDVAAIAAAMQTIASDSARCKQLTAKGERRVKDFDWDRAAAHVAAILFR